MKPNSEQLKTLFFVSLFLLFGLFVWNFVTRERYIYFWDYATYFNNYADLGLKLTQNPFLTIVDVLNTMRVAEYNLLSVVFLMPFRFAFGASRPAYIMAVTTTFGFPVIFLFSKFIRELRQKFTNSNVGLDLQSTVISAVVLALLPQLWIPILLGYLDVVGVAVIFIIYIVYFRRELVEQNLKTILLIGLLCSLLILLRRWYAYWVVCFFITVSLEAVLKSLLPGFDFEKLKSSAKKIFVMGFVALISFFALASKIGVKMLVTNYSEIYSAFRSRDSIFAHLEALYNYFGLAVLICSILGFAIMVRQRHTRIIAAFLFVQFAATFVLFTRTQDIDIHHNYWVLTFLAIFAAMFFIELYKKLSWNLARVSFCVIAFALGLTNFFIVFEPKVEANFNSASFLFARSRIYPKQRADYEQIHDLLRVLDKLTRNSNDEVYILASSTFMNSSILINGCDVFSSELQNLKHRILKTNDVDKRDGLPFQFFTARYVVAANPIAYHLAPENQRVIGVLAGQFNNDEGLAKAYQKLPFEFVLEDGSRVFIFKKQRGFDAYELQKLSDSFVELYPSQKKQFEIKPELIQKLIDEE